MARLCPFQASARQPQARQHLEDIIARLKRQGLAILLVGQNLHSALAVADRAYVLETGKVVYEAEAAGPAGDPQSLVRFLGAR
jgi:branched-chain amino acid transport system ATP-binding protein